MSALASFVIAAAPAVCRPQPCAAVVRKRPLFSMKCMRPHVSQYSACVQALALPPPLSPQCTLRGLLGVGVEGRARADSAVAVERRSNRPGSLVTDT